MVSEEELLPFDMDDMSFSSMFGGGKTSVVGARCCKHNGLVGVSIGGSLEANSDK